MTHSAVVGDVEVPVTYSKDEAVGLLQEDGIVGAGGAGFPTYVKYEHPPATLVVNAADSEPGYYADKLLLRDEPEALVDVFEWLKHTFSMEVMILAAEEVARPYMAEFEQLARRLHNFSIAYIEPKYKFGQEKALVEAVMGLHIPGKDIPPKHGVNVNNNETIFNIYRAIFENRPVTTKFLQVYGEIGYPKVYEAPVGTLAADLLRIYGVDPADYAHCKLYDGGPILAELMAERMGAEPLYPIRRTTNGLLVVHPDKDRPRRAWYPDPSYRHNSADAPWAPTEIRNIEAEVRRVRIPLDGRFFKHGRVEVKVGDQVKRGDVVAEPLAEGLSVGAHASIDGRVTRVTEAYVEIVR